MLCSCSISHAQAVTNVSARVDLKPNGNYIFGFVVQTGVPSSLLFRSVGPTLISFGISNPAPSPSMQIYDSKGRLMTVFYTINAGSSLDLEFASVYASAGAFPLTGGEQLGSACNYGNFQPGSYTVAITDSSGKGGTFLFELYTLSGPIAANAPPVSVVQTLPVQ